MSTRQEWLEFSNAWPQRPSRRDLLRRGALLAAGSALAGASPARAPAADGPPADASGRSAARKVCWEEMLAHEFAAAVAECPVCYMPVGTLERHGFHLAFGNDEIKAHELCKRAAAKHGGVVVPPLHWGTHGDKMMADFKRNTARPQPPGSVYISEGLLIALLLEMFREIEYAGFKVIVCLTGHYPKVQVDCCKAAAAQFMSTRPVKVWALCEPELSGEVEVGRDHAGKWETSLLWALRPDLVDMSRCKPDEKTGQWLFSSPEALKASRELGEKTAQWIADQLARRAKELFNQAK